MIMLKSSDGESFEIEEATALKSETIAHIIEDGCADNVIPLANVNSKVLAKVIEYLKKHVDDVDDDDSASNETKEEGKKWDAEFMEVNQGMLFDVMLAANYLNIKNLLDLTCQTVADFVPGKTPQQLREFFNVENDFTPEEEEQNRKDNSWAF